MAYKYAINYSTNTMVAKAFSEFSEKVMSDYAELMTVVNEVINITNSDSDISEVVNQALATMDPKYTYESVVATNKVVCRLGDILTSIAHATKADMMSIDSNEVDRDFDAVIEIEGLDETHVNYTLNELLSEMNATYHAVAVDNAIATAYSRTKDVVNQIATVRDTISEKFNSAYTDISDTLNRGLLFIKNNRPITEYLNDAFEFSGINMAAEDNISIEQSDAVTYTGASPASAYAWHINLKDPLDTLIVQPFKWMFSITKLEFRAVWGLIKGLHDKISDKVLKVAVDPTDVIKVNEEVGNHTFNIFQFEQDITVTPDQACFNHLLKGPIHFDLIPCEFIVVPTGSWSEYRPFTDITTAFTQVLALQGYTLVTDEGLLDDINTAASSSYTTLLAAAKGLTGYTQDSILENLNKYYKSHVTYTATIIYKFKPINFNLIPSITPDRSDETHWKGYYPKTLAAAFSNLIGIDDIYLDVDSSEGDFFKGLFAGQLLTYAMLEMLYAESTGVNIDTSTSYFVSIPYGGFDNLLSELDTTSITNKSFFDLLTACTVKMSSEFALTYGIDSLELVPRNILLKGMLNNIFASQASDASSSFWPYSQNAVNFFDGNYHLLSDADNIATFNNWINNCLIVTGAIIFSVVTYKKLKKTAYRRMVEAMGQEWNVTEAAQKGILTDSMIKEWKKSKRKANRLSFLTGNLVNTGKSAYDSFNSLNNYDDVYVDLTPITRLITG